MSSLRVLSGIQVTGTQHLGNYLGATSQWKQLQTQYQSIFFLANSHSITTQHDPIELRASTLSTAAMFMAFGIDVDKSVIFLQSDISEHAELSWILNCVTPLGQLYRMTQFKDKATKYDKDKINLGLLSYPVLMAADILLYQADLVPVGEDQRQHLELTRDIVNIVHNKFNDNNIFKMPNPLITKIGGRIMSLRDGRKKMSKSDVSDFSRINLTDSADMITKKIQRAKTDSTSHISYDANNRPEVTNLINIFSALSNESTDDIVTRYEFAEFSKFKCDLASLLIENISPITAKYYEYMQNKDYIHQVLMQGAIQARVIAAKTLQKVKNKFGLYI